MASVTTKRSEDFREQLQKLLTENNDEDVSRVLAKIKERRFARSNTGFVSLTNSTLSGNTTVASTNNILRSKIVRKKVPSATFLVVEQVMEKYSTLPCMCGEVDDTPKGTSVKTFLTERVRKMESRSLDTKNASLEHFQNKGEMKTTEPIKKGAFWSIIKKSVAAKPISTTNSSTVKRESTPATKPKASGSTRAFVEVTPSDVNTSSKRVAQPVNATLTRKCTDFDAMEASASMARKIRTVERFEPTKPSIERPPPDATIKRSEWDGIKSLYDSESPLRIIADAFFMFDDDSDDTAENSYEHHVEMTFGKSKNQHEADCDRSLFDDESESLQDSTDVSSLVVPPPAIRRTLRTAYGAVTKQTPSHASPVTPLGLNIFCHSVHCAQENKTPHASRDVDIYAPPVSEREFNYFKPTQKMQAPRRKVVGNRGPFRSAAVGDGNKQAERKPQFSMRRNMMKQESRGMDSAHRRPNSPFDAKVGKTRFADVVLAETALGLGTQRQQPNLESAPTPYSYWLDKPWVRHAADMDDDFIEPASSFDTFDDSLVTEAGQPVNKVQSALQEIENMLSMDASIDDHWIAREVLSQYAKASGKSVDDVVEEVCDRMDRIDSGISGNDIGFELSRMLSF